MRPGMSWAKKGFWRGRPSVASLAAARGVEGERSVVIGIAATAKLAVGSYQEILRACREPGMWML